MKARVLSWTRIERPPAGFPAGRVVLLVSADDGACRYAVWEGGTPPEPDTTVGLVERGGTWFAE